jgi:hypothetical protein
MTLSGIGYVELNKETTSVSATGASLQVTGLQIVVTESTPLAPIGTSIVVAHADSSLGGPVSGLLSGGSYASRAFVGNTIISGSSFPEHLPCLGTAGEVKTNSGASGSISGILTTGTVTDTAEGVSQPSPSAETTSTVQALNLSALVTATTVTADVTSSGNPPALGDNSSFVGLSVAGFPDVGDSVAPNTELVLAGIGDLWLHRQVKTAKTITVTMVQLVVTVAGNPLSLTVGTVVNVGVSHVGVLK